ncbi:Uncharacterized protein NEOC65_000509 [Neochlamydia sp. AcF65]|nr:Uncharacterized protein [Neochlamydia sp. AcF65]
MEFATANSLYTTFFKHDNQGEKMVNTLTNADSHKNGITISPNDSTITSIKQLPNELLLHIFSFLQAFDLLEVELTCHQWKNLAHDETLWKDLCRKHFEKCWVDEKPYKESYFVAHRTKREHEKLMAFLGSLKKVERNFELAKYIGLP